MRSPRYKSFIGPAYQSQSPTADCATLINWYLEIMEDEGAKSQAVLYPTPGFEQFASVTQVGGSAIFSTASENGRCFAVIGMKFYELLADGTMTERGSVSIDNNPATISWNGDGGEQLFVTSGGNGYCYDLVGNSLTQVAALNGLATMGAYLDGFFLAFDRNTSTVYLSDYLDGSTFDPANFFQRSSRADTWQAMWVTAQGYIFLPGTKTRDYWYNAGGSPVPFAPSAAGTQPDGIGASFSIAENSGTLCWLQTNEDGGFKVFSATGYRGERISNYAIESEIAGYGTIDDAVGETYTARGHRFYVLTFPAEGVTWCVDLDTRHWHKRSTRNSASGEREAWRVRFHAFSFNKHLWVDSQSGKVWEGDETFPTDVDGLTIDRERTPPSVCQSHDRLNFGTLEFLFQAGIGNANDPGADPVAMVELSRDGGWTFGSQRMIPVGKKGEYWRRVKLERNGQARDMCPRLTVSDPVYPWAVIDCWWDVKDASGSPVAA